MWTESSAEINSAQEKYDKISVIWEISSFLGDNGMFYFSIKSRDFGANVSYISDTDHPNILSIQSESEEEGIEKLYSALMSAKEIIVNYDGKLWERMFNKEERVFKYDKATDSFLLVSGKPEKEKTIINQSIAKIRQSFRRVPM